MKVPQCGRLSILPVFLTFLIVLFTFCLTKADGASTGFTIWPATTTPVVTADPDTSSIEVGVRFSSDSNGSITGIRFYKASSNTGTHVGNLWSNSGILLATATFTNETASGWQQVDFAIPVTVTANTAYVASYHTNVGRYSDDPNYFSSKGVDTPPLHALAAGVSGANGVYAYGPAGTFPNQDWFSSNYWVDVVFSTTVPPDITSPTVTAFTIPSTATSLAVAITSFTATDTSGVTGYLVTESSTAPLATAAGWSATAPASYNFATAGSKTLYAWARDASGNVSTSRSASVTITLSDTTSPTVTAFTIPSTATSLAVAITSFTATDTSGVTGYLVTESSTAPLATAAGWSLTAPASYNFATAGSKTLYAWARDAAGNVSTSRSASVIISLPSGGPILIISSASSPFSSYYAEILRAEGFNAFAMIDISAVTSTLLTSYDVAILGDIPLTSAQVTTLTNWVNSGGHLIAMHPDPKIAGLLGLTDLAATISDAYLLVNTASGPGVGIVNQTIQYHGAANLYNLSGAASIATLYATDTSATSNPAVTLQSVGSLGGQAAAFAFDLARSVVYTHQGNPVWAGQERDGYFPVRPDDLFYGNAASDPKPDWINLNKVSIPQADEQQRLLANLIIQMNLDKKPLPRFWYFPRSLPAVVVMTGDDHGWGTAGTAGRFDSYKSASAPGCSVVNWECIRSTSYVWPTSAIILSDAQAVAYTASGFEVALHVNTGDGSSNNDTGCANFTPASFENTVSSQLTKFKQKFPGLPNSSTNRNHCISWSDWSTVPMIEFKHGIRLDTSYYYYPPYWVADRPGFFTGSGMPMRFTDINGNLIDTYQATTQMTDESGQTFPATIDALLDGATGPTGYYGAFVANMHTDVPSSSGSDAIIGSAVAHSIPVISSRQLLTWLDGRNGSTFSSFSWNGNMLSFSISVASGATGLVAMVPVANGQTVSGITSNGSSISYTTVTIKGIRYARFLAATGTYQVNYSTNAIPPVVSITYPLSGSTVSGTVSVTVNASDDVGVTRVEFYLDGTLQATDNTSPYVWSWNSTQVSNGAHSLTAMAYDAAGNSSTGGIVPVTVSNSISLIQKVSNITSSAQKLAVALPANVTAGNLIVVSVSGWPNLPTATAVTDSLGNAYSIAGTVLVSQGAYSAIYYSKNVKGGADTVTVTTPKSGGQISMAVAEFSGIDPVSPLDATAGATGSGTSPSSGNMTPTLAGNLVIGSGTHNGTTVTGAGSGLTMIVVPTEDSNTHQPLAMEYQVMSGNQQISTSFSLSTGYTWTQNGAVFKHK